jgi:uncharacterized membrane-anchored protein
MSLPPTPSAHDSPWPIDDRADNTWTFHAKTVDKIADYGCLIGCIVAVVLGIASVVGLFLLLRSLLRALGGIS